MIKFFLPASIIFFSLLSYCNSSTNHHSNVIILEDKILLPTVSINSELSLESAIYQRRSIRNFVDSSLTLDQISQLLWSAQGITDKHGYRTVPSAGALYPLEIYLIAGSVEGLIPGLYKYLPAENALLRIKSEDLREEISSASYTQDFINTAPVSIVITCIYLKTTSKYGTRGIRYVHMEAGHSSQNIYLQSVSLGLGSVAIGAFNDQSIKNILSLPEDESPLYIMPIGYPK